jgi:hypothetical protein
MNEAILGNIFFGRNQEGDTIYSNNNNNNNNSTENNNKEEHPH